MLGIVLIRGGQPEGERQAAAINQNVMLAAQSAAVGRIGRCSCPPGGRPAGGIQCGPGPVDLVGVVQAGKQALVQPLPHAGRLPVAQAAPAGRRCRSPSPSAGIPTEPPSLVRTKSLSAQPDRLPAGDRPKATRDAPATAVRLPPTICRISTAWTWQHSFSTTLPIEAILLAIGFDVTGFVRRTYPHSALAHGPIPPHPPYIHSSSPVLECFLHRAMACQRRKARLKQGIGVPRQDCPRPCKRL